MSSLVRHVRVRSGSADRAAVRMAVARQLEAADLDVPSIPRSSILVIRRLRDPLPGRLTTHRQAVMADPRWQSAARAHIDEAARSAVRPVGGRIAGDAGAVIFTDEAELFACLALQLASGGPMTWWREATADYARDRSLVRLLLQRPELVPAILFRLVRWNVAEDVVGQLTPTEALSVVSAIIAAQQLSGLCDLIELIERFSRDQGGAEEPIFRAAPGGSPHRSNTADRPETSAPASPSPETQRAAPLGADLPVIAPWRRWHTSGGAMATHHQLLIGLSVTLHLSPASARSTPFALRVLEWFEWHQRRQRDLEAPRPMEQGAAPGTRDTDRETARPAPVAPGEQHQQSVEPIATVDRETLPERLPSAAPQVTVRVEDETKTEDATASSESWEREGVVIQLGGVFFLINLMEYLDLPDSFEAGCGLATGVGAIGTLEALARALSHPALEVTRGDPVRPLLAELDGRAPGEPPRGNGLRTEGLSLPAAWLRDGDGSVVSGNKRTADLGSHLREERWPLRLIQWLEFVMPFIHWRVAVALAAHDGEGPDLLTDLLLLPARVHVTDVHIDVVTSIDTVRVPVRLAGLDRSPGWVRSMQRVVLFHFE